MKDENFFRAHFASVGIIPEDEDYLDLNWGKRIEKNTIWMVRQAISMPIPFNCERTRRMNSNPCSFGYISMPINRRVLYLRGCYSHLNFKGKLKIYNIKGATLSLIVSSSPSYPTVWGTNAATKVLEYFPPDLSGWKDNDINTGFNLYDFLDENFSGTERILRAYLRYYEGSYDSGRQATLSYLYSFIGGPFE